MAKAGAKRDAEVQNTRGLRRSQGDGDSCAAASAGNLPSQQAMRLPYKFFTASRMSLSVTSFVMCAAPI